MGTDPFEEFEFKPLTEGLGFHGAKPGTANPIQAQTSPVIDRGLEFTEDELDRNPFKSPLPRPEVTKSQGATATPESSPVDEILKTLQKNRKLEIELDKKHRRDLEAGKTVGVEWTPAYPAISAIILDTLLITAAGLLCLILMLVITKADLLRNLAHPDTEGMIYVATASLFMGVAFIYTVCTRMFLGFTPGEWSYDMRMGTEAEHASFSYLLRIIWRQALVLITGGLLLPILSLIMGRDVAGSLSGVHMHKKS